MSKANAWRGLNLHNLPSPFYDPFYNFASGRLGISPATVDDYLDAGATATMSGKVITLTKPDGRQHVATVSVLHRSNAAAWVNKFNARSQAGVQVGG